MSAIGILSPHDGWKTMLGIIGDADRFFFTAKGNQCSNRIKNFFSYYLHFER